MNVDTGMLYYGQEAIRAAVDRGEDLVPVSSEIADGSGYVNVLATASEMTREGSALVTARFGPDSLVAPPPPTKIEIPVHQLVAAFAKRLR